MKVDFNGLREVIARSYNNLADTVDHLCDKQEVINRLDDLRGELNVLLMLTDGTEDIKDLSHIELIDLSEEE